MLTNKISIDNQLIQNFYIIGLDSKDIFKDNIYKEPLTKNIEPKVISKFPDLTYSYNNIPNSLLLKHCFPTGFFSIEINDKSKIKEQIIFYFSLENIPVNNLNNHKYKKIYFTCCQFYESLFNYKELYNKKLILNKTENSFKDEEKLKKYYFPKIICIASLLPFPHEFSKILSSIYNIYIYDKSKINYPLEKTIENLVMKIPIPIYGQKISYINFNEKIIFNRNQINEIQNNSIELNILFSDFSPEEVLKLIKYIILEIPLICFSKNKSKLTNIIEGLLSLLFPFNYIYPSISILPSNCYSIIETYDSYILGINEEYNINFFKNNNLDIDEKNIIILNIDTCKIFINQFQSKESQYILLEDLGNEKKKSINSSSYNIELPSHYKKKTFISLSNYIKKVNNIKEEKSKFNFQIREQILYFFTSILLDYSNFIKLDKTNLQSFDLKYFSKKEGLLKIEQVFKVQEFINEFSKEDQPFYERFLQTKLFLYFIKNKIYPETNEDRLKILFFDEKIAFKKNRNILSKNVKTLFLNSDFSLKENNEIKISSPQNFSMIENEFLLEKENIIKALDYFQIISFGEEKTVNIEYNIFPKLLYDNNFFEKSYSEIYLNNKIQQSENYFDIFEKKIEKIINDPKYLNVYFNKNYNLNLIKESLIFKVKRYNYIDLTWLLILSASFWYCESIEREIRFNKIYDILEKIEYIEEDIFTFIFLSMTKYGNDSEVIKFFEFLLKIEGLNNYTIYSILCDKLTKVFNAKYIQKNKYQSIRVTLLMRESAMKENPQVKNTINNDKYIFKKRTFFPGINKDNNSNCEIDEEKIQFETEILCDKCGNLYQIDFSYIINSEISNDLGIKCNLCGNINNNGKLKINVLIPKNDDDIKFDNFELYSATKLFNESKKLILPLIDYKIDIDNFRRKYKHLFYNYIFYFSLRNLSYDFIIPYVNSENFNFDSEEESEDTEFENLEISNQTNVIEIDKTDFFNIPEIGRTLTNIDNNNSSYSKTPKNNNYDHKFFSSSNVQTISKLSNLSDKSKK